MPKNSNRTILYEAIKKGSRKNSIVGKIRRSLFIRKRKIHVEQGKNPFDKLKQTEVSKAGTENWPPKANAVSVIIRSIRLSISRFSVPVKYRMMAVIGFLVIMAVFLTYKLFETHRERNIKPILVDQQLESENRPLFTEPEDITADHVLHQTIRDHAIVIVQYKSKDDLVPVQEHFRKNGIETVINKRGNSYFLMTEMRFESPKAPGSTLNEALKQIKKTGISYKAPAGYEPFGAKPFQDSYAMKLKR